MPKVNVYLPDDLAAAVREARLSISPICQKALAEAVRVVGPVREAVDLLRTLGFEASDHPQVSARVAELMTSHLRSALERARSRAEDGAVSAEDLIVGVLDEPDNLGTQVVQSLDVDLAALREAAVRAGGESREAPHNGTPADGSRDDEILEGLSAASRAAVATALESAVDLGHDFLGCEHLVLALSEQADAAGRVLREGGAKPEAVRRAIPAALGAAALGYANARRMLASDVDRLDEIGRRLDDLEARLEGGGL